MKKLPIVFPVLLALFFSVNESRADLFGNIFGVLIIFFFANLVMMIKK